jgi:hypothetical protein
MLCAGNRQFDRAWRDLLACHRLARLLARGASGLELLVSQGISWQANATTLALLECASPSAPQARAWLRDLQELPPFASWADKTDLLERCMFLHTVVLLRRNGATTIRLLDQIDERRGLRLLGGQATIDAIDWDGMLRTGNLWHDRLVAACRVKDRAAREKFLNQIDEERKVLLRNAGSHREVLLALSWVLKEGLAGPAPKEAIKGGIASGGAPRPPPAPVVVPVTKRASQTLGDCLIGEYLASWRNLQRRSDETEQWQQNLQLAFALAAYRADHGRYPQKLEPLKPDYLNEVPSDLFSGQALIYRPLDKGYLLYSVGANRQDDEGRSRNDTPPGDDLGVRMSVPEPKRD